VALMQRNNNFIVGSVDEVVTEEHLKTAYGINVKIISLENGNGEIFKSVVPLLT